MLSFVLTLTLAACASDQVTVGTSYCVDKYEASVWSNSACDATLYDGDLPAGFPTLVVPAGCTTGAGMCGGQYVTTVAQTTAVYACGKAATVPTTTITWYQAARACENSGKYLCSAQQWFAGCSTETNLWFVKPYTYYANGTCNDEHASTVAKVATGATTTCTNPDGSFDFHGNANEWINDCTHGGCQTRGGAYNSFDAQSIGKFAYICVGQTEDNWALPTVTDATIGFRCCSDF